MVDQDTLKYFKTRLDEERDRVDKQISGLTDSGLRKSLSDSTGEVAAYDNHPADLGSETFERSKDFALRENARIIRSNIDKAYKKIDDGVYGICENCGKDIPLERLEAIPYAVLCIKCKEQEEDLSDVSERPVEEEVIESIFRYFDDVDENPVVYDDEG